MKPIQRKGTLKYLTEIRQIYCGWKDQDSVAENLLVKAIDIVLSSLMEVFTIPSSS
jgi:hypothetical protein